ncbi:Exportin-T [Saccharata proteae CBS 121410]|uniref:Exportin-T n=1 Tax=Saccharata proteae CBS 121410 TaxID=1314787 RepID=A0A9P4HUF1_9PEZI|nr:Exportin-T [Saccharata proteae CBS 121410]
MEAQVENAVQIAWNPSSDYELRSQAINFLNQLRAEPTAAWQACLSLYTRSPRAEEIVRHAALEVVNSAVQSQQLDVQSLVFIKDNLTNYIRDTYATGSGQDVDIPHIQNKMTQTLTYLFASLYASGWESFFDDFRALAGDAATIGNANTAATMLYLRILSSIHDEIADVLMARSQEESKRNADLKDLIRVRDAQKISLSWQEILAKWRQTDLGLVEMCLKTVSKWVSWIDISLVVNESLLNNLFEIAGQQGIASSESAEGKVRDAAIDTFTETVGKKMRPSDKMQLIVFLNLGNVVGQLIASPSLANQGVPTYDNDLAESVAKLVNTIVFDIVKVLDTDTADDSTRQQANELLQVFVPHLLRFFADEYDEICSTVIPSMSDLLTLFRKVVKNKGALPQEYTAMLPPILESIITKMKYDSTATWGEEDEQTDEAEFQELRKRLHVLQQQVAAVDEGLYIETLSNKIAGILTSFDSQNSGMSWRDVELALHEMFLFGELAVRNGGMYAKREPSSIASARLIEMMAKMVESNVASSDRFPVIPLQYMEICVRYAAFFEQNPSLIPKVLENFVRLIHSQHPKLRLRSWYLFFRFSKQLKAHVGGVSQTIIQAIGDLLTIKAELPDDNGSDDMSSDDGQSPDAEFNSQLYLFEAIGCISSPSNVPTEHKVMYAQSVMNPIFSDLEQNLAPAKGGDERAITQIHHLIMAIGTLARGFSDWMPGAHGSPPPVEVSAEFARAAEVVLVALESLHSSMAVRTAARFAFSRFIGVLGSQVLQQLPRWIDGLLSQSSTKDEMATFLRLLDQVVFGFKAEIFNMLDTLLTPLLQRVFAGLAEPTSGTDDEIQLAELRREYLNFLLIILNNDLGSVFISNANQTTFDTIITTIEHFARDPTDYPTARLSISVLIRMTSIWGGPDVIPAGGPPAPTLPGFDTFAMTRFSPLSWSVPASQGFNAKDPQARQVLSELAGLQLEIYKKTGVIYLERLREELRSMGAGDQGAEEYVASLVGKGEKGFKQFFQQFVAAGR